MMATIEALASAPGAASATDSEGNTCLHVAKTPEIVRILLEAGGSNPRRIKNKDGKTAYEVQTREIREVIDQYVLFCGRFDIASLSAPEHATATSVVLKAIDTLVPEEGAAGDGVEETKGDADDAIGKPSRDVVIKLMKEKEVSEREIEQREGTDPKHVVPIVCSSEDADMKDMWAQELKKLGRWQGYTFGIVMPCAQRNLMIIFFQEKLTMSDIRQIFESLARSIAHLHAIGAFTFLLYQPHEPH